MDANERKGWTEIITAEDLDQHMANIGQAAANAKLVVRMMRESPLKRNGRLLVPGCGTGQMFDFVEPNQIGEYFFTFTDLNPLYLEELKRRLLRFPDVDYAVNADDLEETKLRGHYDGVLAVLLLQHIEWKKGIESMLGFNPERLYLIIQEQESEGHAMTRTRDLPASIKMFSEIANPSLVLRDELTEYLGQRAYSLSETYECVVPDNKTMVGVVFTKD